MARSKLQRFADNARYPNVIEPTREALLGEFSLRGQWNNLFFKNDKPLVLELGCGKGEYTLAMAREQPNANYIGIDIKGARIWYGATEALEEKLDQVAFLRMPIDLLTRAFAAQEVSEIWITFPDPQIKYKRSKHRLTQVAWLRNYREILRPDGQVHLKTDSEFLYGYTQGILQAQGHSILDAYHNIDLQIKDRNHWVHKVRTYYEAYFRSKGKNITYTRFLLDGTFL